MRVEISQVSDSYPIEQVKPLLQALQKSEVASATAEVEVWDKDTDRYNEGKTIFQFTLPDGKQKVFWFSTKKLQHMTPPIFIGVCKARLNSIATQG